MWLNAIKYKFSICMLCGVFIGSSPFFSVSTQLLYVPEYKMRTLFII